MNISQKLVVATATGLIFAVTGCGGSPERAAATGCRTSLGVTYPDGSSVSLDRAQAVSLADGGAFTIYVGDYDIPTDGIATATVMPPVGAHQATVYLTPQGSLAGTEPISAGTEVAYTTDPDVLTFSTVLLSEAGLANQAAEGAGMLTVKSVDAKQICVQVDYSDNEKSVMGEIAATVHPSAF